ncbi:MAG TPA: aconitase family protein [Casimicrobiaceae bacterium]|nr:aconitase family protein [Casimicrobiaceae bacterium]
MSVRFTGRTLFLSASLAAVRRQVSGEDLSLAECMPLRDDVSTDEITPTTVCLYHDERLARFAHIAFKVGGEMPIGVDALRNGGFEVLVAGKRYGKGSSRETSPLAEKAAGIRLIVAESFERIYRQNCDNIGILTSTDFTLLDRIAAGESIPIEAFTEGRDEVTREVILAGGLLKYSKAKLPRVRGAHVNAPPADGKPRSLVEKIIARRKVVPAHDLSPGEGMFISTDWRFSHDHFTGMVMHFVEDAFGKGAALERPDEIVAFQDHLILAQESHPHVRDGLVPVVAELHAAHRDFAARYGTRSHGQLPGEKGSEGICHPLLAEKYALPGQVVVGTDSHTPHSGALGCLAFGAGATDIANSYVTGLIRFRMPEVIRVELTARLRPGVLARDVVQYLLATDPIRQGRAIGAVFEYGGPAVKAMGLDERATLTNLVAELGGLTGIVEPDEKTVAFLRERRGAQVVLEDWMRSDPGAAYLQTIRLDCADIPAMVARPGDPGNSVAVAALGERVRVDIAFGGSCTAGKRADFDAYHEVLKWGLEHGLRVAEGTRLYLQFGTLGVRDYCRSKGFIETIEAAGGRFVSPGCGACANCGPGQSTHKDEVSISSINRNFPGRSGPGGVWLGSPYTVAASALAGYITSFEALQGAVHGGAR